MSGPVDPSRHPNPWAQICGRHKDAYEGEEKGQAIADVGWLLDEIDRLRAELWGDPRCE